MGQMTEAEKVDMINRRLKQYEVQKFNLQIDLIAFDATGDQQSITRVKGEIEKMDKAYSAVEALLPDSIRKGAVSAPTTSNS